MFKEVLVNLHSHADIVREFLNRNSSSGVRVQISDELRVSAAFFVAMDRVPAYTASLRCRTGVKSSPISSKMAIEGLENLLKPFQ